MLSSRNQRSPVAELPCSDRDYQVVGVDRIVAGLRGGGRGQVHMACGTGKTKVALWSTERLAPHGGVVVIVAPTVGLVAQTLGVWAHDHGDHRALAVCSDHSVADDAAGAIDDILEPVTTDPDVVDAWLRRPNSAAIRLIIGTHASAHVIGEGLQKAGIAADLLIVDEAHRSAGWAGKHTALLHDDDVLPAARRLYMTATATVITNAENDSSVTVSMDDEQVFGPVLFSYPLSQAIADGYLDDYRLAVIGVARSEVLALLRSLEWPNRAGSQVAQEQTAMVQAATARAAAELGLRRVIAFCPRVADAKRFADTFASTLEALPDHLRPSRPLFATHIDGTMKQARRRELLDALVQPPHDGWTVVSNAKCLSEGIDVPAVDGVAFTAPKRSTVDIVQAIGRALRRDPNGSGTATIIVPILLPDDPDTCVDDIDPGAFETLWQVVLGLRSHDDVFSASLNMSRANGFARTRALERVSFAVPKSHRSSQYLEHLTIRLVQGSTSKWWDGYGQLVEYHARYGHAGAPAAFVTDSGFKLGVWVILARRAHIERRLAPDRFDALTKLGFMFDPRSAPWYRTYAVVARYYSEYGHLDIPRDFRDEGVRPRPWLDRQRALRQTGDLPRDREDLLTAIEIEWLRKDTYYEHACKVREYHSEHGKFPTSKSHAQLADGLTAMRSARKAGRVSAEAIALLDEIGMVWDTSAIAVTAWQRGFAAAVRFQALHDHLQVHPSDALDPIDNGFDLVGWIRRQRTQRQKGRLTAEQIAALDELGMDWDVNANKWNLAWAACEAFYAEYGHLRVPHGFLAVNGRGDKYDLSEWIKYQRRNRGKLTDDQVARLTKVGMIWDPTVAQWDAVLAPLREFYDEHGLVDIPYDLTTPTGAPMIRELNGWRRRHKAGTLAPYAVQALTALGVDLRTEEERTWRNTITHLSEYCASAGDVSCIPKNYRSRDGFALYTWWQKILIRAENGALSAEEINDLADIGIRISINARP